MFLPANITLKFGDSGDFVSELQRRLAVVNCFSADQVNGFFDGSTVNGVSTFQSMSGIRADGIAGPETLRRLNGVISGDTSATNDHNADQDRLRQEEAARMLAGQEEFAKQQHYEQQRLAAEQFATEQATQQQWQQSQAPQQPEIKYAQEAAYAPQQHAVQQQQVIAADAAHQLQQSQQYVALAQSQHSAAHAVAVHHVAPQAQPELFQQQASQQPQAIPVHHTVPVQVLHTPAAHAPAPVQVISPQQPAALSAAAAAAQAAMAQQQQPAVAATTAQAAEPAAPRTIKERVVQYANDMVQKLSNYFESKLRPDVIDQVKEIGLTMAKSGVREAAIPSGPEQQRALETPARGPQQQPVQQRN